MLLPLLLRHQKGVVQHGGKQAGGVLHDAPSQHLQLRAQLLSWHVNPGAQRGLGRDVQSVIVHTQAPGQVAKTAYLKCTKTTGITINTLLHKGAVSIVLTCENSPWGNISSTPQHGK